MNYYLSTIIQYFMPLIITSILHMLIVKYNILSFLKIPISEQLFGANKTYRGFIFVPLANSIIAPLFNLIIGTENPEQYINIGLLSGIAYMLGELPNSYFKRRLGIGPGEKSTKYQFLFIILDRLDSAFGCTFLFFIMGMASFIQMINLLLIAIGIHLTITFTLVQLKIKKTL